MCYEVFDWDDNIVHMPTKIWMEDIDSGTPVPLSTEDFAVRRDDPSLRPIGGDYKAAFREFAHFEADMLRAVGSADEDWKGPAFGHFKRAVSEGRVFAIVTGRQTGEQELRGAVRRFIGAVLSAEEWEEMVGNVKQLIVLLSGVAPSTEEEAVTRYMELCHFCGMTSPEFTQRFPGQSIEQRKRHAVRSFVEAMLGIVQKAFSGQRVSSIVVSMSDDDAKNVQAIDELMRDELSPAYPLVKFVVLDTGDRRATRLSSHFAYRYRRATSWQEAIATE